MISAGHDYALFAGAGVVGVKVLSDKAESGLLPFLWWICIVRKPVVACGILGSRVETN